MPDGPAEVFQGNRWAALAPALFGSVCILAAPIPSGWTVVGVIFFAVSGMLFLPVRMELYPDRICYRSTLGSWEMKWDSLERFYYHAVDFKSLGRQYSFKLVDDRGQTRSPSGAMHRRPELAKKLVHCTYGPLMAKCAARFDAGRELDFGPIRLNRAEGLKVRVGIRTVRIPLAEVSEFGFRRGRMLIHRSGEKPARGPLIRDIPNAFVLLGMLEKLCPNARSGNRDQPAAPGH
jgi:hypothetical protein